MQRLGFPSMKSLDHFKSLAGSVPATSKSFSFSSRPASDSISSGSFANLKLTAGFDGRILVVCFIISKNTEYFIMCVVDFFVFREIGERTSFCEDWSGNFGMIFSISPYIPGIFLVCVRLFSPTLSMRVCAYASVCASISEPLFTNYGLPDKCMPLDF